MSREKIMQKSRNWKKSCRTVKQRWSNLKWRPRSWTLKKKCWEEEASVVPTHLLEVLGPTTRLVQRGVMVLGDQSPPQSLAPTFHTTPTDLDDMISAFLCLALLFQDIYSPYFTIKPSFFQRNINFFEKYLTTKFSGYFFHIFSKIHIRMCQFWINFFNRKRL